MKPETSAGKKAQSICQASNITLAMLRGVCPGLVSWDDRRAFSTLQKQLRVDADGLFWAKSAAAFCDKYSRFAVVDHQFIEPPRGVKWLNFLHPNVHHWGGKVRWMEKPDVLFVHESVTRKSRTKSAWEVTVDILTRRHLSVCIMIHRDNGSSVTQHCDTWRRCTHAPGFNNRSLSVECVNAYYGKYWHPGMGGELLKPCDWSHKGKDQGYITTTEAQNRTLARVIEWSWDHMPTIPRGVWAGRRDDGSMVLGKLPKSKRTPRPGIWAHHYTAKHADGSWPVAKAEELIQCPIQRS